MYNANREMGIILNDIRLYIIISNFSPQMPYIDSEFISYLQSCRNLPPCSLFMWTPHEDAFLMLWIYKLDTLSHVW